MQNFNYWYKSVWKALPDQRDEFCSMFNVVKVFNLNEF